MLHLALPLYAYCMLQTWTLSLHVCMRSHHVFSHIGVVFTWASAVQYTCICTLNIPLLPNFGFAAWCKLIMLLNVASHVRSHHLIKFVCLLCMSSSLMNVNDIIFSWNFICILDISSLCVTIFHYAFEGHLFSKTIAHWTWALSHWSWTLHCVLLLWHILKILEFFATLQMQSHIFRNRAFHSKKVDKCHPGSLHEPICLH